MIKDTDPVIVSAARTALGSFGGGLSTVGATDLGGLIIEEAVRRASLEKKDIQEVIMGMVLPCGYGQNPGRQAAMKAGIPMDSGGLTINKVCGSGLMSVVLASELIRSGYTEIAVAGGMENMSMAPYYFPKARWGSRMGDAQLVDHMVHDGLWDIVNDFHMGITNDIISEKWSVSRQDQDVFALKSYEKALRSIAEGKFKEEIMPVTVKGKKGDMVFDTDECPKETSLQKLSAMKPAFQKNGYATAGNSSVISDGASALIVMSYRAAKERGITPLAKIRASGSSGIELQYVLMAPINSIPKVAKKAGVAIEDIEIHEINEAFAGSSIGIIRELRLDEDKVNVNGGSVALGHPIGASGARLLTTLIHEMKRKNVELGEASLCLGGAEAVTMIVENM